MSLPYSETLGAPACWKNKIRTPQHHFQALSDLTTRLSLFPALSRAAFIPTPPPKTAQHVARCADSVSSGVSPLSFAGAVSLPGVLFSRHHCLSQPQLPPNKTNPCTSPSGPISNVHIFLRLSEHPLCRAAILSL